MKRKLGNADFYMTFAIIKIRRCSVEDLKGENKVKKKGEIFFPLGSQKLESSVTEWLNNYVEPNLSKPNLERFIAILWSMIWISWDSHKWKNLKSL